MTLSTTIAAPGLVASHSPETVTLLHALVDSKRVPQMLIALPKAFLSVDLGRRIANTASGARGTERWALQKFTSGKAGVMGVWISIGYLLVPRLKGRKGLPLAQSTDEVATLMVLIGPSPAALMAAIATS